MTARTKILIGAITLSILGLVYWQSGFSQIDIDYLRGMGKSPWVPVFLVSSMAVAWALAFPASAFFFIVPLFYGPWQSTVLMIVGNSIGAVMGYTYARFIGGVWIENHREHRIVKFLERNSNTLTMFAIRVAPSSPHGLINYAAGLVRMPIIQFLVASALATAVKAFVYASAVNAAVDATAVSDVLTWKSFAILVGFASLAIVGRWARIWWKMKTSVETLE